MSPEERIRERIIELFALVKGLQLRLHSSNRETDEREKRIRDLYRGLKAEFAQLPLSTQARLRGEFGFELDSSLDHPIRSTGSVFGSVSTDPANPVVEETIFPNSAVKANRLEIPQAFSIKDNDLISPTAAESIFVAIGPDSTANKIVTDGSLEENSRPKSNDLWDALTSALSVVKCSDLSQDTDLPARFLAGDVRDLMRRFVADLTILLLGVELEGLPLSFGILIVKDDLRANELFDKNTGSLDHTPYAHPIPPEWEANWRYYLPDDELLAPNIVRENQKAVTRLREVLGGRANGGAFEPLIVMAVTAVEEDNPYVRTVRKACLRIRTLGIPRAKIVNADAIGAEEEEGIQPSAHVGYRSMTKEGRGLFAFWLRPHGSLRVYCEQDMLCQIMRSRTGHGYIFRFVRGLDGFEGVLPSDLIHPLKVIMEKMQGSPDELRTIRKRVKRLFNMIIFLSELKHGAAIYFIIDDDLCDLFVSMISKGGDTFDVPSSCVPTNGYLMKQSVGVTDLTQPILRNFLCEDGSVLVNRNIEILACGVYFSGQGGRRQIARAVSRQYGGKVLALVLSQDGSLHWNTDGSEVQPSLEMNSP